MRINSHIYIIKNVGLTSLTFVLAFLLNSCDHTEHPITTSPFEYREIHLAELAPGEITPLRLNCIDSDWGIWGHNLSVVLPDNPSSKIYAKNGNALMREQFCFSSDALFEYISKYIKDNFDDDDTMRFAILPNDNSIVCQCVKCIECGNTKDDSSGAIYYLLERLTKQFPNHLFFTSYYRTTGSFPKNRMPENAGVLISAINFPLCSTQTPQEEKFVELLNKWHKYTGRIYIWDYINNFDDYFTPFPVFEIFQHRLRLYAQAGVQGVFMNGSGHEYSTFYRLKTHMLSMLLSDPNADWRTLLKEYCAERYPVTGNIIYDFLIKQEDMVKEMKANLSLYDGVANAVNTYLPAEEFADFHNKLFSMLPKTEGDEHKSVERIVRATMLTHLELNRMSADTLGCNKMLRELEKLTAEGIVAYSEAGGTLKSYVDDYRYMLRRADEIWEKDLLKGVKLEPLTPLDEDYNDISVLTDGLLGLPSCYHCGQMLSSATPALQIAVPHVAGMSHLRVNMTKNAIFHISLPLRVVLTANGHEIGDVVPTLSPSNIHRAMADFDIPSNCRGKLILTIYRDQEDRTMALDEIEGY